MTTLPDELKDFVEQNCKEIAAYKFCGWDHAESAVWRITCASGKTIYLKAHKQNRKYVRELNVYQNFLPHLPKITPELLEHKDDEPRALLLAELPGILVEHAKLTPSEECDIHKQAGVFLRDFHSLEFVDEDTVPPGEAIIMRMEHCLKRAEGIIDQETLEHVKELTLDAAASDGLRRVPCHRDYTPRNWMIDDGKLGVFDFEHSIPDIPAMDMFKLYSSFWYDRVDLRDAFIDGYGISADDDAFEFLNKISAFYGVSTIVWSREHNDTVYEKEGWRILKNAL